MEFQRRFQVNANLEEVRKFHERSSSMAAITPPPIKVSFQHAPDVLMEGNEMSFTLWMGPMPINWVARIENVSNLGFQDRLLSGPYKSWIHLHRYRELSRESVEIVDNIKAELHRDLIWKIVGWIMWINMPILFSFRAWKTRQILKNSFP